MVSPGLVFPLLREASSVQVAGEVFERYEGKSLDVV
jgi:hypothetical protein